MKKTLLFLTILLFVSFPIFSQNYDLGQKFDNTQSNFELVGISSKDNSKMYRFKEDFSTTVFSYTVDKFEIRVYNDIIVSLHFVLNPKDKTGRIPKTLIEKVKLKSGREPLIKGSKYYFDDESSKTVIFRQDIPDYGGDKIHTMTTSSKYLYK